MTTQVPGWFAVDNAALDRAPEIGPSAFLVYVALCRHANQDRRCWPSTRRLATLTGFHRTTVMRLLEKLEAVGWLQVERQFGVTNRYHLPPIITGSPHATGRTRATPTGRTRATPTGRTRATPTGRTRATPNKTNRTRPLEQDQSLSREPRFSPEDLETATWMFGLVKVLDSKVKKPSFSKWAETIRLTREQDGRTDAEIRAVFAWANADGFWRSNILSPAKLRDQFTQVKLKMEDSQNGRKQQTSGAGQRYTPGAKVEAI